MNGSFIATYSTGIKLSDEILIYVYIRMNLILYRLVIFFMLLTTGDTS